MIKKIFFTLVILSALIFQVPAEEKKPDILSTKQLSVESLDISPNPVGQGDLFTVTIIVNHDNPEEVELPLKELPDDLLLWRGPYIRSFIDEDKNGGVVRKTQITVTLKAQRSGRSIFPSLSVFVGNKHLKTEPKMLNVGLYKNRKLYIPLEVEWRAGFDRIYLGEAVPIFLVVKNQDVVVIFDRTRIAYPRDGFFEKASGIGQITTTREGNVVLYDIPAETFIYTAHVAGRISIPSSGVDYDEITGWTDNFYLNVERPPAAIQESGAIGEFNFTSGLKKNDAAAGEIFELELTIEGSGNLNYLKMPEPDVRGCILVSSEEKNSYVPSLQGFSGAKSVIWMYESESPGTAELRIPEFEYFNKKTEEVISFPEKVYRVKIDTAADDAETIEPVSFPFEKKEVADPEAAAWKNHYLVYYRYIWLFPAMVFFFLVKIMRGKKIPVAVILTAIIFIAVVSVGRFSLDLKPKGAEKTVNAAVLYNDAVDSWMDGRLTDCLHDLRTAIYLDPINNEYREVLDWVEQQSGFVNSVQPAVKMHPDIFYYILIVSCNLSFLAAAFGVLRSGGGVSVLIILFAFTAVLSVAVMAYSHTTRMKMTGIICSEGSSLKKIPRESAENWVPLSPGTAVGVLDSFEGFILVETGLGVKGWINGECILPDRPDSAGIE